MYGTYVCYSVRVIFVYAVQNETSYKKKIYYDVLLINCGHEIFCFMTDLCVIMDFLIYSGINSL